jgi:hypothetical protein
VPPCYTVPAWIDNYPITELSLSDSSWGKDPIGTIQWSVIVDCWKEQKSINTNNMNTIQDDKDTGQSTTYGAVRMGREVLGKQTSGDPDKDLQCAQDKEKERIRKNEASGLV